MLFCFYGQNQLRYNINDRSRVSGKVIKDSASSSKIAFIGSHVSALPKEVLELNSADFILYNEGVYGLIELLSTDLNSKLEIAVRSDLS